MHTEVHNQPFVEVVGSQPPELEGRFRRRLMTRAIDALSCAAVEHSVEASALAQVIYLQDANRS
jgi:hypothetical protein